MTARTWLFGKDTFAYPWLRWLCTPLLRIGLLLVGVPIAIEGHTTWVSTVGVVALATSIVASLIDYAVKRWRRTAR